MSFPRSSSTACWTIRQTERIEQSGMCVQEPLEAGMAVAERGLVEPAAERGEDVPDDDLLGRPRQRVSAGLPARRRHEAAAAQDAHHLGDVGLGDALGARELGNGDAPAGAFAAHAEEAAQSVLFLRRQFHERVPPRTAS